MMSEEINGWIYEYLQNSNPREIIWGFLCLFLGLAVNINWNFFLLHFSVTSTYLRLHIYISSQKKCSKNIIELHWPSYNECNWISGLCWPNWLLPIKMDLKLRDFILGLVTFIYFFLKINTLSNEAIIDFYYN